jgi:hypothetical protein
MPEAFIFVLGILFITVGIPVICGTLIKLAKVVRGDRVDEPKNARSDSASSMSSSEETQLIQEIHRSMNRLESRIDSLETIVIQSEPKRTSSPHE